MKTRAGWALACIFLVGCGSSGSDAAGGAGGTMSGGGSGGSAGVTSGGTAGTSSSGNAGATAVAGAGQALYGNVGAIGTATVPCQNVACPAHQVCCELMLGNGAQCLDSFEACAELASKSDPRPPAYGCASSTQCAGGKCCGTPNLDILGVRPYIASSCRDACLANEDEMCADDSECTAPETCGNAFIVGKCF